MWVRKGFQQGGFQHGRFSTWQVFNMEGVQHGGWRLRKTCLPRSRSGCQGGRRSWFQKPEQLKEVSWFNLSIRLFANESGDDDVAHVSRSILSHQREEVRMMSPHLNMVLVARLDLDCSISKERKFTWVADVHLKTKTSKRWRMWATMPGKRSHPSWRWRGSPCCCNCRLPPGWLFFSDIFWKQVDIIGPRCT